MRALRAGRCAREDGGTAVAEKSHEAGGPSQSLWARLPEGYSRQADQGACAGEMANETRPGGDRTGLRHSRRLAPPLLLATPSGEVTARTSYWGEARLG